MYNRPPAQSECLQESIRVYFCPSQYDQMRCCSRRLAERVEATPPVLE